MSTAMCEPHNTTRDALDVQFDAQRARIRTAPCATAASRLGMAGDELKPTEIEAAICAAGKLLRIQR